MLWRVKQVHTVVQVNLRKELLKYQILKVGVSLINSVSRRRGKSRLHMVQNLYKIQGQNHAANPDQREDER